MSTQPNNHSTPLNPVGHFMVAVGAIIQLKSSNKILVIHRSNNQDWQPSHWEIIYGRIDQHEDLTAGLRREVQEETGISDLKIGHLLTHWHIYRGAKSPENEVIGVTFLAETSQEKIKLSDEHDSYQWVEPQQAVDMITVDGIKRDVLAYIKNLSK